MLEAIREEELSVVILLLPIYILILTDPKRTVCSGADQNC